MNLLYADNFFLMAEQEINLDLEALLSSSIRKRRQLSKIILTGKAECSLI